MTLINIPATNVFPLYESEHNEAYIGHLAAIVESSDDAIISKALDGTILSWNKGGEKMFGYTAAEAIGKNITILIPPEFINQEKGILKRIKKNEIINHYEAIRQTKAGKKLYVSLTVSPLKDRSGNIIGISKIARDITARKKSETELIVANKELLFQNDEKEKRAVELIIANKELTFQNNEKEKRAAELIIANGELVFQNDEKEKRAMELILVNKNLKISETQFKEVNSELESFSYSVSHDLRAPLRAVNGYARMLKSKYEPQLDDEANRLLNNITNNAKKMGQLIDDLLSFSHIGRKELTKADIPMNDMVTNLCNDLTYDQQGHHIEFQINNVLSAEGDYVAIKQVWFNLISNAIKYSRLKNIAIIEIGSETIGNDIIYHIKDNGAGFDMRYVDKLFGVFQRLHSDEEFEGTGVGLALVKRIITKHEGRVWAEGKVSEGATFFFTLKRI